MEKVFVTFLIKFADINIMYWLLDIITVCSWHGMSWDDDMTSHRLMLIQKERNILYKEDCQRIKST